MITKFLALGAVALALSQAGISQAAGFADGNFSQGATAGSFTTIAKGGTIGPWKVTGNSVDLIGTYWEGAPSGGYTVDLDGNGAGGIKQTFSLTDGVYQVSFYLGGNPDGGPTTKSVTVGIDGVSVPFKFKDTGATHADMNYELETFDFTVTSPANVTLSFVSNDAKTNPWGPVIGGVAVTAVPEPSSLALLLAGVGLIGTVARRRSRSI